MRKFILVFIGITILFFSKAFCQTATTPSEGIDIGSLYMFEDGSRGIVFYAEGEHGLVVSLNATTAKWCSGKLARMDIPEVPNRCDALPRIIKIGEGEQYSRYIYDTTQSPAVAWCFSHGDGWYLPSSDELCYLLKDANAGKIHLGPISKALKKNGGKGLAKGWYWTSSECDKKNVVNIDEDGDYATELKTEKNLVRAIRAF